MMESIVVTCFAVAGTLVFLSLIAVGLRIYVRLVIVKAFGIDDYLMVLALIFYVVDQAFIFRGIYLGAGKTLVEFLPVFSPAFKAIYFGELFYTPTVLILKLSIGAFLLRLVQARAQKIVLWVTIVIFTLYSTGYFFLVLFQCSPVDYFWNRLTKDGKCVPTSAVTQPSYVHSAIIACSDVVFACIPIVMVWNLQMNRAMKFSVASLLCFGTLGGITTFIRIPYLRDLGDENLLTFITNISNLMIWSCIEPGVGIIVGSAATLRPLFRRFLGASEIPSVAESSHTSRKNTWRMSQTTRRSSCIHSTSKNPAVVQTTPNGESIMYTAAFDSQDELNNDHDPDSRVIDSRQTNDYEDEDFEMGIRASMDHRGLSPMPPRREWPKSHANNYLGS